MKVSPRLLLLCTAAWLGAQEGVFAQPFQTINTGAFPGDPSADSFRTMANKINGNFSAAINSCGYFCVLNYRNASGNVPGTSAIPEDDSSGINAALYAIGSSFNLSGIAVLPPASRPSGKYYLCQTPVTIPGGLPSFTGLHMLGAEIDILPGCTPSSSVIAGMVQTASAASPSGYPQSDYQKAIIDGGIIDGRGLAQPMRINAGRTVLENLKLRNAPGGIGNTYAELVIANGGDISFGPGMIFGAYNDPGNTIYPNAASVPAYGVLNIGGHDSQLGQFTVIGAQIAGVEDLNGSGMRWLDFHPFGNAAAAAPNNIMVPQYSFEGTDQAQEVRIYADTPQAAYMHITHGTTAPNHVVKITGNGFSTQSSLTWPANGIVLDAGAQVDIEQFDFQTLPAGSSSCISQTGGTFATATTISNNQNCPITTGSKQMQADYQIQLPHSNYSTDLPHLNDSVVMLYLDSFVPSNTVTTNYSAALDAATTEENTLFANGGVRSCIVFGPYFYSFLSARTVFPAAGVPDCWKAPAQFRTNLYFAAAGDIIQATSTSQPAFANGTPVAPNTVTSGASWENIWIIGNPSVVQNCMHLIGQNDSVHYDVQCWYGSGYALKVGDSANGTQVGNIRASYDYQHLRAMDWGPASDAAIVIDCGTAGQTGNCSNEMRGFYWDVYFPPAGGVRFNNSSGQNAVADIWGTIHAERTGAEPLIIGSNSVTAAINGLNLNVWLENALSNTYDVRILGTAGGTGLNKTQGINLTGHISNSSRGTLSIGCIDVENAGGVKVNLIDTMNCYGPDVNVSGLKDAVQIYPNGNVSTYVYTTDSTALGNFFVAGDPVWGLQVAPPESSYNTASADTSCSGTPTMLTAPIVKFAGSAAGAWVMQPYAANSQQSQTFFNLTSNSETLCAPSGYSIQGASSGYVLEAMSAIAMTYFNALAVPFQPANLPSYASVGASLSVTGTSCATGFQMTTQWGKFTGGTGYAILPTTVTPGEEFTTYNQTGGTITLCAPSGVNIVGYSSGYAVAPATGAEFDAWLPGVLTVAKKAP